MAEYVELLAVPPGVLEDWPLLESNKWMLHERMQERLGDAYYGAALASDVIHERFGATYERRVPGWRGWLLRRTEEVECPPLTVLRLIAVVDE